MYENLGRRPPSGRSADAHEQNSSYFKLCASVHSAFSKQEYKPYKKSKTYIKNVFTINIIYFRICYSISVDLIVIYTKDDKVVFPDS